MPLGKNLKKDTLIPSEKKEEKQEAVAHTTSSPKAKKRGDSKAAKKATPKAKAKKASPPKKKTAKESAKKKVEDKSIQKAVVSEEEKLTPGQLAALVLEEEDKKRAQEESEKAAVKEKEVAEPVVTKEDSVSVDVDIVPAVAPMHRKQESPQQSQTRELVRQKIGTVKYLTEEEYQEKKRLKDKFDEEIKGYSGKDVQLIVFKMGGERYAIEIDRIKEVVHTPRISKIPHAPDFIKGVGNVRGSVMVVLDLGLKFGIDESTETKQFILVIHNDEFKAGILVDEVPLAMKVPGDNIVSSSGLLRNTSLDETYIKGIIKTEQDMIIFIDIAELVQEDEVSIISQSLLGTA
ncbi:hypothetical protein BFP72_03475 [Reichenbachiella sp. 5M10]|uniref:chemotaxis protein CheW n=1 Tax=Reichenbachiella sp. 5M10 TaxID=1889772 RepID=UPI000C148891|nr:chemotaxis protein CheW [Reichenbachiella sp. 5M10]PIB34536.1 hypothetical protein BFP72_03475 [Reichenbachiella sp. 5M10]